MEMDSQYLSKQKPDPWYKNQGGSYDDDMQTQVLCNQTRDGSSSQDDIL